MRSAAVVTRGLLLALGALGALAAAPHQKATSDALARARQAYNAEQYDAAIAAAAEAARSPASSNAAAVVMARALLERYRLQAAAPDLDQARAALQKVVPAQLGAGDYVEYLLALGISLYLDGCPDGCYSGAAEMFALALPRAPDAVSRERVFEWWAGALDRQAQYGAEHDRVSVYERLLQGAERELASNDRSASASYWLASAARGAGQLERAWGAVVSAWVRAPGMGPRGAILRSDLEKFVTQILLPERARLEGDPRAALARLSAQWEEIKAKYKNQSEPEP
jgi:hypothetical protein